MQKDKFVTYIGCILQRTLLVEISRHGSIQNEAHIQIKLTFNENTQRDYVMTEKAIECLYACTAGVAAVPQKNIDVDI
jgi:hypothetical protein